jgi:hypothetical protein
MKWQSFLQEGASRDNPPPPEEIWDTPKNAFTGELCLAKALVNKKKLVKNKEF